MDALEQAAREVAEKAYCPYSHYRVGAALEADDGSVWAGCNVENASYSLTICAERSALVAAVSAGRRRFRRVVIVGGEGRPAAPCGACRQMLFEFNPRMEVVACTLDPEGERVSWRLDELLVGGFGPEDLGIEG